MTGTVLLVCCANVAGLMLVRGAARTREMAVRTSMGATRARLASMLFAESLALALPAVLLSLPIAMLSLRALSAGIDQLAGIPTDGYDPELRLRTVLVAIGATLISAVASGLFPAFGFSRTDPAKTLQAYDTRQSAGKLATRFSATLASVQIALSVALIAMGLVFAQSVANIARVDLGLDADSVVTFSMSPGRSGYAAEDSAALYVRLEEALAAIPGVTSVSSSEFPWLSGFIRGGALYVDDGDEPRLHVLNYVGANFLDTLGIALLAGRDFDNGDNAGVAPVAIVNRRLVEQFGLGQDIVGTQIRLAPGGTVEIVGLAANAKYGGVTSETEAQVFRPRSQSSELATATFYVRGARQPEDLMSIIRTTVTSVEPIVPITGLQTMEQRIRDNVARERFVAATSTAFAVLATILAGLGLYGVLAYSVAQRSREMGLRYALGASANHVRGIVLRRVLWMGVIGVALGSVAAVLLGRAAQSILFGIDGVNALSLAGAAVVTGAVSVAAAYFPARRASSVDPIVVLRYE